MLPARDVLVICTQCVLNYFLGFRKWVGLQGPDPTCIQCMHDLDGCSLLGFQVEYSSADPQAIQVLRLSELEGIRWENEDNPTIPIDFGLKDW